ncbi:MAG: hypothetical protein JXA09_16505 [Anaerolineae bacterium]|nr:hypothetical protein [Anaerolineae bacterium]
MHRSWIPALLTIILLLSACGGATKAGEPVDAQPEVLPPPEPGQGLSQMAGRISRHPRQYEGHTVVLVGYYRGLDLLDEVILDAPVNRVQDWVIADDSGALWVAFADKLPFLPTSHEVWRIVRVTGMVRVASSGMAYIYPNAVEWEGLTEDEDVLPARCRVALHRTGGLMGLDHHIYWYETGSVSVIDRAENWRGLVRPKETDENALQDALDQSGFFDLPSEIGEPCPDCIRYSVAAVDPQRNRPHFVVAYDGSVPDALQALIDRLIAETAKADPVY